MLNSQIEQFQREEDFRQFKENQVKIRNPFADVLQAKILV